jgi:pullulanase
LCDKGSLKTISGRIGAFCDDTRDAVKGSLMDLNAKGFVNGGGIHAYKLHHCLTGWAGSYGAYQTPYQTITYLSCHDDWTLWDKLVSTMDEKKNFAGCQEEILRANRLAAAINFCCQGRPFFLAGEEFGRTKGGIKNSYCSSIRVNQLDWERAWKNEDLVNYYRGLIALRQQLPGLTDKSAQAKDRLLWTHDCGGNCAAACVDNRGESPWKQLILVFNCGDKPKSLRLPEGKWQLLCDGQSSFRWQENTVHQHATAIEAHSALILGLL